MTKLRQKVTFQIWYNKSRGSETISEPEINKNLDWYIVNNFLIKVDEVKSDENTSKDNETSLSDFFHRLFPRFRHMQLDNSPKDGPSIKTTLSSYNIYWQWEMTTRYEVTNESHNQHANNGLWHLFKNEKWIETQTGQKLTNTTKVYPKIHGQNKIVGHHIENQIWTSCIQSF